MKVPVADENVRPALPGEYDPDQLVSACSVSSISSSRLLRVASTSSRELSSLYESSSGEGKTARLRDDEHGGPSFHCLTKIFANLLRGDKDYSNKK